MKLFESLKNALHENHLLLNSEVKVRELLMEDETKYILEPNKEYFGSNETHFISTELFFEWIAHLIVTHHTFVKDIAKFIDIKESKLEDKLKKEEPELIKRVEAYIDKEELLLETCATLALESITYALENGTPYEKKSAGITLEANSQYGREIKPQENGFVINDVEMGAIQRTTEVKDIEALKKFLTSMNYLQYEHGLLKGNAVMRAIRHYLKKRYNVSTVRQYLTENPN